MRVFVFLSNSSKNASNPLKNWEFAEYNFKQYLSLIEKRLSEHISVKLVLSSDLHNRNTQRRCVGSTGA